jgi:mRNA interferase RelE/StbE
MYRIFETENFLKSMEHDFGGQRGRITKKLKEYVYPQLQVSPEFGANIKKLRDWHPPTWRYRIGPYRFFFEIDQQKKIVFMILAEHRGKAYR